jgi:nitrite reductase/ring-hydroxylating ferredoxin subunit
MKKVFSILLLIVVSLSCSKDTITNNNPYLPTYRFTSSTINLTFPLYINLQFPGNAIEYNEVGVGILNKVFIINTGSGYLAFDAACPNQNLSSCSEMNLVGIKAECSCDGAQYSLYSGQATDMQYPMLQYRVEVINATSIRVYN